MLLKIANVPTNADNNNEHVIKNYEHSDNVIFLFVSLLMQENDKINIYYVSMNFKYCTHLMTIVRYKSKYHILAT